MEEIILKLQSTVLCDKHFHTDDIIRPCGGTRKRLKKDAKPFLTSEDIELFSSTKRKEPTFRSSPRKIFRCDETLVDQSHSQEVEEPQKDQTDFEAEYKKLVSENQILRKENLSLEKVLTLKLSNKNSFVQHIMSSDAACNHYTSIPSLEILNSIFEFLDAGTIGENIILYNNQNVKGGCAGRPRTLSPLESFLLTLVRLRRNFDIYHLAYLFSISEGTVTNTVITWINLMYIRFGSVCIWPTRSQVDQIMPKSLKEKFPTVRCIIDCVEFKVSVPSSLFVHKMMYSDYKSHTTVKVLVGIAPGGGFTFVSSAYPGSISDKDIVIKSGLLYPELFEKGDTIMADRGFLIEEYLKPLGVDLIIPSFLKGRDQFKGDEVVKSQQIAAERIHVERMIQRLKCFHIFDRVIPVNMLGSLNQTISVCAFSRASEARAFIGH